MSKGFFAGTFDPITIGHVDIVNKALEDFEEVVIGIGINEDKVPLFDTETREKFIKDTFKEEKRVRVVSYTGWTVDKAAECECDTLIRGIRDDKDLIYEKGIEDFNKRLNPNISTKYYYADRDLKNISSTMVRNKIKNKEDTKMYLPNCVSDYLRDV